MLQQNKACYLFFLLFLVRIAPCNANGRWAPGYIVKAKGDTLYGFVAFHHTNRSPVKVSFKSEQNKSAATYEPKDLKMFSVHEEGQDLFYTSMAMEIDISEISLDRLNNNPYPVLENRMFFAQLLMQGRKNLYWYVDNVNNKPHYLIEDENGKITELINNRYYVGNERTTAVYSEAYKKQIGKLLADCNSIRIDKINAATYSKKKIGALMNDYYKCNTHDAAGYCYQREKGLVNFGVVAGVGVVKMYIQSPSWEYSGLYKFKRAIGYSAGVSFNFVYPHTRKAWSMYNELLITHYDMHAPDFSYTTYYTTSVTKAEIKQTALKLVDMIRYTYPGFKYLKPFIQFGIGNAYAIQLSATSETNTYSSAKRTTDPIFDYRQYEQSYCFGGGAAYKRYGIELRYEPTSGISAQAGTNVHFTHLLFSYRLK